MKKQLFKVSVFLIFVGTICNCTKSGHQELLAYNQEIKEPVLYSYIPWKPVEYTYHIEPDIDSESFYIQNKEIWNKQSSLCRLYYTQYARFSIEKVREMADSGDAEAMYQMYAFSLSLLPDTVTSSEGAHYLQQAAEHGHLAAIIAKLPSEYESLPLLDEYEKITPSATLQKYLILLKHQDEDRFLLIDKMRQAGGYYFLMSISVMVEEHAYGTADKDTLCEAYFKGCTNIYDIKQRLNIICSKK